MSEGILINRVEFKINKKKFDEKYVVLKGEFKDRAPRRAAVKVLAREPFVRAIRYDYKPGEFYVLCRNGPGIKGVMDSINRQFIDGDPLRDVPIDTLKKHEQIELLNIGLGCADPDESGECNYSNMEGALFMFNGVKVKDDHIEALNIRYRAAGLKDFGDVAVDLKAKSFYDWNKRDELNLRSKNSDDYVKYVTTDQGNMKMLTGSPKKNQRTFILHGYPGRRASIPFYDVGSPGKLESSKAGMLVSSHRDLLSVYGDIFEEFGLVRTDMFDDAPVSKKYRHDEDFRKELSGIIKTKTFKIYDYLNTAESKQVVEGFITDVKDLYGIDIEQEDEFDPSVLNIAVVQKKRRDENHDIYSDKVVQHLAMESIAGEYTGDVTKGINGRKSIIAMTLLNAIIKEDVLTGRQSFLDWMKGNLITDFDERDWYYVNRVRIQDTDPNPKRRRPKFDDRMAVMKLFADGSTEYRTYEKYGDLTEEWMRRAHSLFDDYNIRGVLSDGVSIYSFCDTDVYMIPEVEKTRQILFNNPEKANGKKSTEGIRGTEDREEQLKACTDIRSGTDEYGNLLYFVGTRGDGMDTRINWAANLHKVEYAIGSEPLPRYQLELMLAPFVRYLGMTVIPYPFKYLHEYERMHGLEDFEQEPNEETGGAEDKGQMSLDDYFQDPAVESD